MAKVYRKLEDAYKNPEDVTSFELGLEEDEAARNAERLSSMTQFINLKQLNVTAAACDIPEELGQLQHLRRLRLELLDCGDDPLPTSLGTLKNLMDRKINCYFSVS